uniref:Uncharacterized protein n=1 Tax=Ciona savignyi TaxID=51511 RepID=H2YF86_CIOSA
MYLLGRCLRIRSEETNPDDPKHQWSVESLIPEMLREVGVQSSSDLLTASVDELPEVDGPQNQPELSTKQMQRLSNQAKELITSTEFSNLLLSQATEVLAQSINMALHVQAIEVVSSASLEMVECCAQLNPQTATLYLALHQSAEASRSMKELVMSSVSDPSTSQFAALLHQETWLMQNSVTTGLDSSSMRKNILKILSENFTSWKRLQLTPNHLDLMKDIPPAFNIVVLQHSPDKQTLYCGVM